MSNDEVGDQSIVSLAQWCAKLQGQQIMLSDRMNRLEKRITNLTVDGGDMDEKSTRHPKG